VRRYAEGGIRQLQTEIGQGNRKRRMGERINVEENKIEKRKETNGSSVPGKQAPQQLLSSDRCRNDGKVT
jgi:hypothetical protein